jgi:hypothetical protein
MNNYMNATEFLEQNYRHQLFDQQEIYFGSDFMIKIMEEYAQQKLDIASVSKSVNCEHTGDETLHQGNGFVYKTCADCGEDI